MVAEFIIHLSEKHQTPESFRKALIENGAECSDSFTANLLRIIQHMKPGIGTGSSFEEFETGKDSLALKFPGLAIPNEKQVPLCLPKDESKDQVTESKVKVERKHDTNVVDDIMLQLEANAPSSSKQVKRRERSR